MYQDKKIGNMNIAAIFILNLFFQNPNLIVSKERIILSIDQNTTNNSLKYYKEQLKEKNINFSIYKINRNDKGTIDFIEITVNCNDGFKGRLKKKFINADKIGFLRDYTKNSDIPFSIF